MHLCGHAQHTLLKKLLTQKPTQYQGVSNVKVYVKAAIFRQFFRLCRIWVWYLDTCPLLL